MTPIETIEAAQLTQRPAVKSGDTVRVHVKVREGDKERIQVFEGLIIGMHRGSTRASITSCIALFMPTNSESRSWPLPRWLQGLSVT